MKEERMKYYDTKLPLKNNLTLLLVTDIPNSDEPGFIF